MVLSKKNSPHACRWHRRKEERPEEIVDAALQLFSEKGFAATRMSDVARQAGISKGTLYLYFDSKEAIFREVVRQVIEPQIDHNESMVDEFEGTAPELLALITRGMWHGVCNSRLSAIPKLIISESTTFPELAQYFVDHVVKRSRKLLIRVIEKGIERGELMDCNPVTTARLIAAPLVHAAIWMHSLSVYDDDQDADEYIGQFIGILLHGIATDKGSSI